MEFGKVEPHHLASIDFRLPDDDARTWEVLRISKERSGSSRNIRVGVGAPVWDVPEWVGKVYPTGTAPKDFLVEYAKQFNSIELNTTHYRIPDPDTITRWRESTPEDFKFNVKWPQDISHRALVGNSPLSREFYTNTFALEGRLGISFLQLPPHFSASEIGILKAFLAQVPKEYPIAVEARHPSFFQDHQLIARYYDVLRAHGVHAVITDVSGRRDVLHTSLPTSKVLVRFIGNALHPTDHTRVDDWVSRLKSWFKLGLDQVEFLVHQPDNTLSPELITAVIAKLNAECGTSLRPWIPWEKPKAPQMSLFD